MPARVGELYQWGGVDSRSNPANFPPGRAIRCLNFVPQLSGALRLRYGFSTVTMSTVSATAAIHSAAYYELFAGTQYVLFGQGTALKRLAVSGGAVTDVGTLASSNPWGTFRAFNRLYLGNGTDFKFYDGTTLRNSGIRAPNSTEKTSVTAVSSTATAGSFDTTTLTGYQFYIGYYNPTTGHVGNRSAVAGRVTIAGAGRSVVLGGLPNLSGVDGEWVKLIGRTPDGGEVPYAITDSSGNWVTAGNTATTATITSNTVDYTSELPTRNTVGSGFDKFTRVLGRIFGAKPNDPFIYYSEAEEDAVNGDFVGRPEESWPANNVEAFPTGEVPTALHSYRFEGWFFTRNHLAIWSEFLRQQVANPWRGPWPGGCAGQRAFVETAYGPYWVSADKQLMTFGGDGPIPVSEEYEKALLRKISDANLATTEIMWLRDPEKDIDRLVVKGKDASNNPVIVVHDFKLRDGQSPFGQAYEYTYTGMVPNILVGAGYSPRLPVRDTNKKERLWAGSTLGRFFQLEDGTSDAGGTYTGDYISLLNLGLRKPLVIEAGWIGDSQVAFSYSIGIDQALAAFVDGLTETVEGAEFRQAAKVGKEAGYFYGRFQLTSHPADGNFDPTDPTFVPVNSYGTIYRAGLKFGGERPEAR